MNDFIVILIEILMFYMGVKSGYGSPQTLTSESKSVKKGQKGDLQALRPHLMNGVPVGRFYFSITCYDTSFSDNF